jgi:hypothetical protein
MLGRVHLTNVSVIFLPTNVPALVEKRAVSPWTRQHWVTDQMLRMNIVF